VSDHGSYAIIPTHNRPDHVVQCVAAIQPQVDLIQVIDNASDPPVTRSMFGNPTTMLLTRHMMQPPNLSALWNIGIRAIEQVAFGRRQETWDVAILNDDAIPPPGWFIMVSDAMRKFDGVAACSGGIGREPVVYGPEAPPAIHTRLQGWAFMLRGERGLKADEMFRWWCGDDDLSMQARNGGGLVTVPGLEVPNLLADSTTTGVLQEQSARDMAFFVQKWGVRPW